MLWPCHWLIHEGEARQGCFGDCKTPSKGVRKIIALYYLEGIFTSHACNHVVTDLPIIHLISCFSHIQGCRPSTSMAGRPSLGPKTQRLSQRCLNGQ